MKRIASTRSSTLLLLLVLILIASPLQHSVAQSKRRAKTPAASQAPPSQWLAITVTRIRPEMLLEYQEFAKNETIPALKKGGVKERNAFTTAVFGENFEYVYVTPIESFAEYDGPGPTMRALGEEGTRAYAAKARRLITGTHTYAVQTRPDLSYAGKMTGPPKLAVINSVRIAPGRNADFENIIKSYVLPAMKKAEVTGYVVSQTVLGGDVNEYVSLTFYDNFADIGKGSPLVRAMGQAGFNRFVPKVAGIIVHQERTVGRFVPELSFQASAKAENK